MAKENFVYLHGQLYSSPNIYVDSNGVAKKAAMAVKILRRPQMTASGEIVMGRLSVDIPVVMTMDETLIKEITTLRQGDMVDIKGVYTTREIVKKATCPNGHEYVWAGNFVFITPIYICAREKGLSASAGLELMKKRAEVSNIVMLIGTLCREPELVELTNKNGQTNVICQYQLASNRRYHIRDGIHEDEKTDYPWVKTSGKQAREDKARLHTGSTVYLNAAIQTREIERTLVCPECQAEFTIKESICELYPYSVEYLMNCDLSENPTQTEEKAVEKADEAESKAPGNEE